MIEIDIRAEELAEEKLSQEHVEQARRAILEDGFVILNNAVSNQSLDHLRAKMAEDTQILMKAKSWGGAGTTPGHLQQAPPPFSPYLFRDILANPLIVQVSRSILGENVYLRTYSSNTNCPESGMQPLHRDITQELWPGMNVVHPPYTLAVNISLVEVTEENGAIELWPGTHNFLKGSKAVEHKVSEERRRTHPPVRGCTRKGSVLIRDKRIWHRGMPNHSNEVRHMLSMMHNIFWLKGAGPVKFGRGSEAIFENCGLAPNYDFTAEDLSDYLFRPYPVAPI